MYKVEKLNIDEVEKANRYIIENFKNAEYFIREKKHTIILRPVPYNIDDIENGLQYSHKIVNDKLYEIIYTNEYEELKSYCKTKENELVFRQESLLLI